MRIYKIAIGIWVFILLSSSIAFGQEHSSELSQQALHVAKRLETVASLDKSSNKFVSPEHEHLHQRLKILEGFDSSGEADFKNDITEYKLYALENGDKADLELANFYQILYEHYNPYRESEKNDLLATYEILEKEGNSENWVLAHSANTIAAILRGYDRNFVLAVDLAAKGFDKIPENQNLNTKFAKYYSYFVISYLHGTANNAELYLNSMDSLIDASLEINTQVESVSLLNNLIYSMKGVGDSQTKRQLVDILLRVGEKHPSDTPGLVEMRAALTLVRIGDFERALAISQKGLEVSENPSITNYLKMAEIQSLAALGQGAAAESKLAAFRQNLAAQEGENAFPDNEVFKAQGLIAMARGDANGTFRNMDRHAELSIQRLLRSNNTDTSNLLANLENDKARQAEREAAREREFRLQQEALKQRVSAFQRGLLAVLFLALMAILTAAFMFYRSRTATKLAIAAEAALAGEQAKSQFLAVISHELRTPLNGIIGIADLLSRTAPSLDLRRKIGIINNSGQDLLRLVEQILDMSRIDADEMEVFPENANLRDVIDGIDMLWRPTIENKGVIFTSHVDSAVPDYLTFDPLRLRQCINNLVSNAAKFTENGRVHMHVTAAPVNAENKHCVSVIVADTGMGIRPDVQDNLFKPFVQADSSITRQYGGSGLGLAITRSLARMMGGDLTVTSRVNAGSEFTLTIMAEASSDVKLLDTMDALFSDDEIFSDAAEPAHSILAAEKQIDAQNANATAQDSSADNPSETSEDIFDIVLEMDTEKTLPQTGEPELLNAADMDSLENVRILIVEDMPSNQDVMKIFLEPEGCVIMCADNGVHALSALRTQDFDVVLMDIRMPEMDGIEATRLIRSEGGRNAAVPIIALTADATAETNAQCMAAGANIFLTKPIIATELFDSIRFVRRQALNRSKVQDKVSVPRRA